MREYPPCKDCILKHEACHDVCGHYKQWLARYHAQKEFTEANQYTKKVLWNIGNAKTRAEYKNKRR